MDHQIFEVHIKKKLMAPKPRNFLLFSRPFPGFFPVSRVGCFFCFFEKNVFFGFWCGISYIGPIHTPWFHIQMVLGLFPQSPEHLHQVGIGRPSATPQLCMAGQVCGDTLI